MKLQPFSNYQPSGVQWCPELPSSWKISTVKRVAKFTTGWTPPSGNASFYGDEYFWANISDIGPKVLNETNKSVSQLAIDTFNIESSKPGDLLFSFKLSIGQVSFVGQEMFTNEAIATFKKNQDYDIRWAFYAFPTFIPENAEENIYGAPLLNQERIKNAKLFLPPLEEQKLISRYLDKKTSQIDSLINKIEKKIELLKEQRTSLINQYVTKGLDTDVEMKNSGNKLVGLIPKHWKVVKASYILDVRDGTHDTPTYVDDGVPLVTQKDIFGGVLSFERTNMISTQDHENISKRSRVVRNDVIMSMIGSIGFPTVVETDSEFSIKNVCLFRTSVSDQNPHFIKYVLESNFGIVQLELGKGGGVQSFVSLEVLRNLKFLIPPRSEQDQIVDLIKSKSQTIDRYISLEQRRLSLLNEFRQSFISSATTGKLRVTEEMI